MSKVKRQEKANGQEMVACAFCKGRGTDPYDLLSSRSRCEVCKGKKRVPVAVPHERCAFCAGTGSYKTFSCPVCRGKGAMPALRGPTQTCPECEGRAFEAGSGLACLVCNGRGRVEKGTPHEHSHFA